MSKMQDFPNLPFSVFAHFVENNFSSHVSLATVLTVLFLMTENTDLLNLHARQKHKEFEDEQGRVSNSWIRAFARAVMHHLQDSTSTLFQSQNRPTTEAQHVDYLSYMLDDLATILKLTPHYNDRNELRFKVQPVSYKSIQAAAVVCPHAMYCCNGDCYPRSLQQITNIQDIPLVALIKGNTVYHDVPVLTGKCTACNTIYHADHEHTPAIHQKRYLNSACYLKAGHALWTDCEFSRTILSGVYNFHASASAYTQFWNDSNSNNTNSIQITCRQVWQLFVQESIWAVATAHNRDLKMPNNLDIKGVVKEAFAQLGNNGVVDIGIHHECSECSHPYKSSAGNVGQHNDPASVAGLDETNSDIPMVVVDGIVMGPTHCAYDNCTEELQNAHGGAFCIQHETAYGNVCRMQTCGNQRVAGTLACATHQGVWKKYKQDHNHAAYSGWIDENLPWQQRGPQPAARAHDNNEDDDDPPPHAHFFGSSKFYCVETVCAPCRVVIAWTKFDKSESPTCILNFLQSIFPTAESRPGYVCIDKACQVLRTAIANGTWRTIWKDTT
ncbi:hypothetical protein CPB84DRAFT_1945219 [Gymnopilus junonius]|uniref:CxC5 like cysteine cluster associated with KDZ domain-containing protein n=1 Tax=Gymnopilus junonius TaxID=109634 RepID=A0A9P5N6Z4_GYMJU|nr:hypothetical protein CPB84DRAFT_1945219 [Gymnopilus junonius]